MILHSSISYKRHDWSAQRQCSVLSPVFAFVSSELVYCAPIYYTIYISLFTIIVWLDNIEVSITLPLTRHASDKPLVSSCLLLSASSFVSEQQFHL